MDYNLIRNMVNFDSLIQRASILALIGLLFFSSSTIMAADVQFCTNYALTSVEQYWRNVNNYCGFKSPRWNANYNGQYQWCLSAHQWVADNETRERKILLDKCVIKKNDVVNNLFLQAINENAVDKAEQLLKQGANINVKTTNTALIKELGMRYQKLGRTGHTRNNEAITDNEWVAESALSFATHKGLLEVGLWLLDQQKKTLPKKEYQYYQGLLLGNGLIAAVKQENKVLVLDLLNKGANINFEQEDNNGTALYFSVLQGSEQIAHVLLERQANPNYSQNAGGNMLNQAMDNPALLELLLKYHANPNSNGEAADKAMLPIMQAVKTGNVAAVELLMQYGANADVYDYDVPYPLITAIKNQHIAIIRVLLRYKVNTDVVYNPTSFGNCVQGGGNSSPFGVALATKNKQIISLFAGAKSTNELCSSVK